MKLFNLLAKNKFILVISIFIIALLVYEMYNVYLTSSASFDRSSYFEIIKWRWMVIRWEEKNALKEKWEKVKIHSGDIVYTIWPKSVWVISWWDGSLTRLAWNSRIEIKESFINDDLTQINVDFKLVNWKSWSNVVTFMWEDSYFSQEFDSYVAWVRWTVFEVNLEEDYVYVKDHEVSLEDKEDNKNYKIKAWEVFSINLLELIDQKLKDIVWEQLNNNLDKEYIRQLYKDAVAFIEESKKMPKRVWDFFSDSWNFMYKMNWGTLSQDDLDKLWIEQKTDYYNSVLARYQKLNFVTPDESELFKEKMRLKEILINLDDKNNKNLIKYSLYDLDYAIKNNLDQQATMIWDFLSSRKIDVNDLWEIMWDNLDLFQWAPGLKKSFWDNWKRLEDVVWVDRMKQHYNNVVNTVDDLKTSAEEWIKNAVEEGKKFVDETGKQIDWAVKDGQKALDEAKKWAEDAIKSWLNNMFKINK